MLTRSYDYAAARERLSGLVLNLPVPFHPVTFDVDHDGLRRNVEFWVDAGVRVLLLTYGSSSLFALSDVEIVDVTRTVVEASAGRAFVIASTGVWWLGQNIEFAHICENLGADALMVTTMESPGFTTYGDVEQVTAFYRTIQERTSIPLMYLCWHATPQILDAAERICALQHVIGLKQDFDSYPLVMDMGLRLGDKTSLVCGGGGALAYWAHQFGFRASLTGVGQWAPRLELRGVAALMSGDLRAARAHLDRITPFRQLGARVGNHGAIKHAMDVAGLVGGPMRPPQTELSEEAKSALTRLIHEHRLLELESSRQ